MGEIESYKQNCEYIRETFSLPEITSMYALVNKITEEYKILKDKLFIEQNKEEASEKSEKSQTKEKKTWKTKKKQR